MGDVTSHPLANQAEACLFGRSLNPSLCEIYDHKAAFLLVKTVLHKNFNLHIDGHESKPAISILAIVEKC